MDCAVRNQVEAIEQLANKAGPIHDRWQRRLLEALQRDTATG